MAAPFAIFAPAYGFIDARLELFLSTRLASVLAEIGPAVRAAVALYIILYGIAILRGAIAEPVMDFAIRGVKLVILSLLATTVAYQDYVTEPLFRILPETLARALSGPQTESLGGAFDDFYARAAYLAETVADEASLTNITPWLMSAAVYGAGAAAAAVGFGIVLLAKIALALLIALGPIFVACALFEATRRYFFGWLSQALNYIILFALILAVLQLILALVADQWPALESADPMVGAAAFVALCLLAIIFFIQTPTIAAGIAGGAAAGVSDFATLGGFHASARLSLPRISPLPRGRLRRAS